MKGWVTKMQKKIVVAFVGVLGLLPSAPVKGNELWTGFRGVGSSQAAGMNLPLSWELRGRSPGSWNVRLPGYGQSSPAIWGPMAVVTSVSGEQKEHLHVLAIAVDDGKVLWQKDFEGTQRVKDSDAVSRGAPTPTIDRDRIYVVFESGDIFALSHQGETLWNRSFVRDYGEIQGPHGYASSPLLVDDLLILQVAHSGPSYLLALDRATGKNRWKIDHPSQTGWSSPALWRHGDKNCVIVSTSGSVRAVDAASGNPLWNIAEIQGNSTASPTVSGNRILIASGGEREGMGGGRRPSGPPPSETSPKPSSGTQKDESSGATKAGSLLIQGGLQSESTQIVWRSPKVATGYASPLIIDDLAYFVTRVGVAQCVSLQSGEVLWQHRLPSQVWASPVACDGNVLFFCKDGSVVCLKASPELVEVAESNLSTTDIVYGVAATPGAWLIRTGRGLVKIAKPDR